MVEGLNFIGFVVLAVFLAESVRFLMGDQ